MTRRKPLKPRTPASLRKYGLTVEEWQEMLALRNGRCWICGKGGLTKHLNVDHDHTLEKEQGILVAYGLLCGRCNRAKGAWEWDVEVMKRAIEYLKKVVKARTIVYNRTTETTRRTTESE